MAKKKRTPRGKNPNRKLKKKIALVAVTKRVVCKSEKKTVVEHVLQRKGVEWFCVVLLQFEVFGSELANLNL